MADPETSRHPPLSMAWRDAKKWAYSWRELAFSLVIGVGTVIGLVVWGPNGTGGIAVYSLVAVGVAAVGIPVVVFVGSLALAPHRLLVRKVDQLVNRLDDEATERDAYLADLRKRTDRDAILNELGKILSSGNHLLEYYMGEAEERDLWDWEFSAASDLKRILGVHEMGLFESASSEMELRSAPSELEGGVSSWRVADAKLRWLRRRIEKLRDED